MSTPHQVSVKMQFGRLYYHSSKCTDYNGFPEVFQESLSNFGEFSDVNTVALDISDIKDSFYKYCHSVAMIDISSCSLQSIIVGSNESLRLFFYDNDGRFISRSSVYSSTNNNEYTIVEGLATINQSQIPNNAKYIKLQVEKSTYYTTAGVVTINVIGPVTLCKNSVPKPVARPITYTPFHFETSIPTSVDAFIHGQFSTLDNEKHFDTGCIVMPPNYSIDGPPVPLVLFLHGSTTNMEFFGRGVSGEHFCVSEFLAKDGFAVADCSGATDKYCNVGFYGKDDPRNDSYPGEGFGAPSYFAALVNLVKFITANYNIDSNNIFVSGKSAGGFMASLLAELKPFQIKAVGMFSPALSPTISLSNHASSNPGVANMEAEQLGIDVEFVKGRFNNVDKASILDNIDKWRQTDGFFRNSTITDSEMRTVVDQTFSHTQLQIYQSAIDFTKKSKSISTPTKIWISQGDTTVWHSNSALFVQLAQKTNSPCFLRSLPNVSDAHNVCTSVVEFSANGETVKENSYNSKYGGTITSFYNKQGVPVAMIELIQWFNKYKTEYSDMGYGLYKYGSRIRCNDDTLATLNDIGRLETVDNAAVVNENIECGVFYKFLNSVTEMTLTLVEPDSSSVLPEYAGKLSTSSEGCIFTVTTDSSVSVGNLSLQADSTYEFYIVDGLLSVLLVETMNPTIPSGHSVVGLNAGLGSMQDAVNLATTNNAVFQWLLIDTITDEDDNEVEINKIIWHVGNGRFIDALGGEITYIPVS